MKRRGSYHVGRYGRLGSSILRHNDTHDSSSDEVDDVRKKAVSQPMRKHFPIRSLPSRRGFPTARLKKQGAPKRECKKLKSVIDFDLDKQLSQDEDSPRGAAALKYPQKEIKTDFSALQDDKDIDVYDQTNSDDYGSRQVLITTNYFLQTRSIWGDVAAAVLKSKAKPITDIGPDFHFDQSLLDAETNDSDKSLMNTNLSGYRRCPVQACTGAISKTTLSLKKHKSKPPQPLSKILADILCNRKSTYGRPKPAKPTIESHVPVDCDTDMEDELFSQKFPSKHNEIAELQQSMEELYFNFTDLSISKTYDLEPSISETGTSSEDLLNNPLELKNNEENPYFKIARALQGGNEDDENPYFHIRTVVSEEYLVEENDDSADEVTTV